MSTDSFRAPDRIRVIDAFRGIAILCVMAFHYWGAWFPNAWLGVEFFFIISGFVIFLTLERHCRSLLDFVMRRVARLYPTFVFCAVCSFTLAASGGYARASSAARELVSSVFLVAPYLHVAWLDGAYWSLLIEAKFYFWAGLLYFAAPSRFAVSWALFTLGAATAAQFFYGAAYAVVSAPFLPFFAYGIGCYLQYRREAITRDSILLYAAALIAYGMLWRGYPVIVHAEVAAMAAAFQLFLARRLDWLTSPPPAVRRPSFLSALSAAL